MTSEEALGILKEPDRIGVNIIKANDEEATRYNAESLEALNMAFKALELMKTGILKDCESCREQRSSILEDFIKYANDKFGITITAVKSDNPDTFSKIFGEQQPYTQLASIPCTLEQLLSQDDMCLVSVASVKEALKQQPMDEIIDDHYWKGFNNGIRTSEWRATKQQSCDNDCEHCEWVTCPKDEALEQQELFTMNQPTEEEIKRVKEYLKNPQLTVIPNQQPSITSQNQWHKIKTRPLKKYEKDGFHMARDESCGSFYSDKNRNFIA